MGSMKEKMHTGELYLPGDPKIVEEQTKRLERLYDYNMTRPTEETKRQELLKEMLAEVGKGVISNRRFIQISAGDMYISENSCMQISI